MARMKASGQTTADNPFRRLSEKDAQKAKAEHVHVYGNRVKCMTDTRGYATPQNADRVRIVVDSSEGYIPLWARRSTLRWRFQSQTLALFENPTAAAQAIRRLLGEALLAWGDAVPVRFSERRDAWDFEISVRNADDCDAAGCTLASAFFPDSGRHELLIYPKMFEQSDKEQVETLAHELGHVFGLRHFFAKVSEKTWPAEIFGTHKPFSIMNYGAKSKLTADDRKDLKNLYEQAWSGQLSEINGTPIRLVRPFHYS
jgi:hypothetical protein